MVDSPVAALAGALPIGVLVTRRGPAGDAVVAQVSERLERILGVSPGSLVGRPLGEALEAGLAAPLLPWLERALAGEEPGVPAHPVQLEDGSGRRLAARVQANGPGEAVALICDFSADCRIAGAWRRGEERYRVLAEAAQDAIFIAGRDGRVEYVNGYAASLLGRPASEVVGRLHAELIAPEVAEGQERSLERLFETGEPRYAETRVRFPGGERFLGTRLVPLRDDGGYVTAVLGISRDLTEERRAEAVLKESEKRYRMVLESIDEIIYEVKGDLFRGRVELVGGNLERHIGWTAEELREDPSLWFQSVHPEDLEQLQAATGRIYRTGEPGWRMYRLRRKGSEEYRFIEDHVVPRLDEAGRVIGVFGVARDVTERHRAARALRETREQLLHAQRLEAVARLAGGIAHDFNNLLTGILGYGELLMRQLEPDHPGLGAASEMFKAAASAASLTGQLLAFSRKQLLEPRVLDLNRVVRGLEPMLSRVIGEDLELRIELEPELGPVLADPSQLEQVLMNLAVNARDAMPDGGTLRIATSGHAPGEPGTPAGPVRPGDAGEEGWVCLSVCDTGHGLDPVAKEHLFEPFFTTKERGRGTGLGLSTVYGIVKQSGGDIRVESSRGQGASFHVYLPRHRAAAPEPVREVPRHAAGAGTGTILLVEDDDAIRSLVTILLQARGFTVLACPDAEQALARSRTHRDPIDLLLTDIVLPGMNGFELARRMRELHPGVLVLGMSGYADQDVPFPRGTAFEVPLLQKPFRAQELYERVHAILEGRSS